MRDDVIVLDEVTDLDEGHLRCCPSATDERFFMKFGMEIMPLEPSPQQ
jgi:hypothetical protein